MFDRFTFSDVINYIVVGAITAIGLMIIYPSLWGAVSSQDIGVVEGLFGISLLYVLGFFMMIANEFLDAIAKNRYGDDHACALWIENFFGMHYLPGAFHYKETADGCDDQGVELLQKYFDCDLSANQLKAAYWQFARAQVCSSVYIHRLRVLHVFAANLSTAFGVCSVLSLTHLILVGYNHLFQSWFFLICAALCFAFRFGRDRLISDRNHAMFESACYGVLDKSVMCNK